MTTLKTLADARPEILKAELAALLHNLGKCSSNFIRQMIGTPPGTQDFSSQYIPGFLADWFRRNENQLSNNDRQRVREAALIARNPLTYELLNYSIQGQNVRDWFQTTQIKLPAPLDDRKYTFGELIEFHKGWHKKPNPRIVIIYRSEPKVTALLHAAHDGASGGEKEGAIKRQQTANPKTGKLAQASGYGFETEFHPSELDHARDRLIKAVLGTRPDYGNVVEASLRLALGDTQRPINDVTLWDLSAATAALFKASVAEAILQGYKPWPDVRWRLLHISFDGPNFWGEAHHVTDMLGRREVLKDSMDALRDILELG